MATRAQKETVAFIVSDRYFGTYLVEEHAYIPTENNIVPNGMACDIDGNGRHILTEARGLADIIPTWQSWAHGGGVSVKNDRD